MITFNNIVERFEIFAENHFFIQTFSFGSPDDVDLTKFTNFPLMHLVYTGATYDAGTKTYNLEVYILDVPADKNQKVERQKKWSPTRNNAQKISSPTLRTEGTSSSLHKITK